MYSPGFGDAYTDCLGSCVEQSIGADPDLMAQCVETCKQNFLASDGTGTGGGVPAVAGKDLIPGVPNKYIAIGAAAVVMMALFMRR